MQHFTHVTPPSRPDMATAGVDPRLEWSLRLWLSLGILALLLLPSARGSNVWLGWMPLWLLAMPLSAWWAAHRFQWPWSPLHRRFRHRGFVRSRPQARRVGVRRTQFDRYVRVRHRT